MKLGLAFLSLAALAEEERTKLPVDRLDDIHQGLHEWCDEWLSEFPSKDKLTTRLDNLVERMEWQFEDECALLNPPKNDAKEVERVSKIQT